MLNFPWPGRRDVPAVEDVVLAEPNAARQPRAEVPPGLRLAADVLAALSAEPLDSELAGEAAALAEYRHRFGVSCQPRRSRPRRRTLVTSLLNAKAAAAAAIAAVVLGGAATAAYAGKLPASIQRLAHDTIGAPAAANQHASGRPAVTGTPVGPNATGPAAFGLCTAFAHATAHGTAAQRAVAFRNLAAAAGGADKVAAFCAAVPHPGASASHPAGPPTGHPTGPPASHPTGRPTSHPTGPPTSRP